MSKRKILKADKHGRECQRCGPTVGYQLKKMFYIKLGYKFGMYPVCRACKSITNREEYESNVIDFVAPNSFLQGGAV